MAPSKEKQLNFLKAQRVGQRLSSDDVMKKLQSTIDQGDPGDLTKVRAQLRTLQQCFALVVEADEKIGVQLDDEEELQTEVTEAQQYSLKVKTLVSEAEVFVEDNTVATAAAVVNTSTTSASDSGRSAPKVKLPQLRLTPFSGDPLKWQEFWDSFESTVHNADLAPADKFKYLKEFLKGNALLLAEGYRMTADNYEAVVEQLQQRYGDKELAIQSHFDALLTLKPASGDINELQRVYDECEVHIRSLVTLDLDEDTFGRVFAPILKSKVPEHIRLELERRHDGGPWTLSDLRQLLRSEIHARRMSKQTLGANTTKPSDDNGTKPKGSQAAWNKGKSGNHSASASALIADGQSSQPKYPCDFCKKMGHFPSDCPTYTDAYSRKATLKGNCVLCLRFNHKLLECRTRNKTCFICGAFRKHHRSLCPQRFGKTGSTDQSLNVNALAFVPQAQTLVSPTAGIPARRGLAVMQTALATVRGTTKTEKVRLLFDTASNRSFARTDLLRRIGAKSHGVETLAVAGLGSERRIKKNYDSAELDVILADGSVFALQVNGISSISSKVQKQAIDLKKFRVLAGLELADPIVDRPELVQVDILVGLDNYYSLVGSEQCRIGNLAVIDTKVGLIISGCISQDSAVSVSPAKDTTMMACAVTPDQEMYAMVENLWKMESIGICDLVSESDDELAQRIFDDTVSMVGTRYNVRWPFKPNHPPLPSNYGLAYGRLKSLVRRLQRDPELFEKYNKIITDQTSLGVVEEAPSHPEGEMVYYIPHQPELKPTSATTKVRVVYDATAKVHKDVPSLNECLIRGPVYLADLCGLLMRFRCHEIGIVSDIEKAFWQVGLPRSERDVTRFLWLKDISKGFSNSNIKVLRFCRVLFGLICSPFLLAAVIRHHLSKVDSKVCRQILDNNYVDNIITGCSSLAEAKEYYREAKGLFSEASMNLREWYSNSPEFTKLVAENDRGIATKAKVLGLSWDLDRDQMNCILGTKHVYPGGPTTKRIVLRVTASLFDPCGYFAPITVRGKLLLQKLWQLKCTWDEDIPDVQQRQWKFFYDDFRQIPDVRFQRYFGFSAGKHSELHVFCDASMGAYGAAAYLRIGSNGPISSTLIFAKSRISPSKDGTQTNPVGQRLTVAKLELTALVLGSKMAGFIGNQLDIPAQDTFVWSDSQCSLQQVMGNATKPVFVKNRVQQVKANGEFALGYVPTEENPADMLTRNQVTIAILQHSSLWWNGPAWLLKQPDARPGMPNAKSQDVERVEALMAEAAQLEETQVLLANAADTYPVDRFSSWQNLLRVTAYVLRFAHNVTAKKMGHPKQVGPLLSSEVKRAKERWISVAQQGISELMDKKPTPQIVHQLGLVRDGKGFVRCSGKLDHSDLPDSAKYPLFFPKDSSINRLLVDDVHRRLMHGGPTHMLAQLRQEFWIAGARCLVRSVRSKCMTCRKAKGGSFKTPQSAPLPSFRTSQAESFSTVGIDYLGPVYVKDSGGKVKSWICLFTCGHSRAVHLEVVMNMTADQFLLALRRFVALRGKPDLIVCDNAKTFHTSSAVVDRLFREAINSNDVQGYTSNLGTDWKFIVELAPWMGGFYERMVGLVKDRLRCVLQKRLLSLVEMQTVCAEVVSILNSRPLTYCEDEVGSTILTPGHLLNHRRTGFITAPAKHDDDPDYDARRNIQTDLVAKWKRIQAIVDQFWETWQRQYLVALRGRYWNPTNRGASTMDAAVGTVVLIKEAHVPRGRWQIGRIIALDTSFDGIQRSAQVQLPDKNVLRRPLKLLCPVEVPESHDQVEDQVDDQPSAEDTSTVRQSAKPKRAAAIKAKERLDQLEGNDSGTEDF